MPPTVITITTLPLDWSPMKIGLMRRDILQMLAQEGAPNCKWEERDLATDKITKDEPEEILYLALTCECLPLGMKWYAEKFTPCPQCGKRDQVKRAGFGKVKLPEGAAPGALHYTEPQLQEA